MLHIFGKTERFMDIAAATGNKNKINEIKDKLSALKDINVISYSDLGINPDIEENADTFCGNALIKAREVCRLTGLTAMADDSGLVVDALDGEPGIYSARYGGPGLDDRGRYMLLLEKMKNIPEGRRGARFVCAIALVFPDGREITAEGECEGLITAGPEGEGGFGYDPVFYVPEKGKTMAMLSMEEKNMISHRGRALEKIASILKEMETAG